MNKQLVVFVYPDSVDVFERTDAGDGRVEYTRVHADVVRNDRSPGKWFDRVASVCISLFFALLGG